MVATFKQHKAANSFLTSGQKSPLLSAFCFSLAAFSVEQILVLVSGLLVLVSGLLVLVMSVPETWTYL